MNQRKNCHRFQLIRSFFPSLNDQKYLRVAPVQRLAVINVVGLSSGLLGEATPRLTKFVEEQGMQTFPPAFPAVTCTAQSNMLTGKNPSTHGIVANGWYDTEGCEVKFWKQSNRLVHGEKIWDVLHQRDPSFTCANLFWWYNMASTADITITPRPLYLADGKKSFDIHTQPMGLRESIKADLGEFPFPSFWGPAAGIACSQWISRSAQWIEKHHAPQLSLVYLPHLDYGLQKFGPAAPEITQELRDIDAIVGELLDFYQRNNVRVIIVSEYGISAVDHPIHINRELRKAGLLSIKEELGRDGLDVFMSDAFAVADHQMAHVYVREKDRIAEVKKLLENIPGVEKVMRSEEIWTHGIATARAGDLVAITKAGSWFTYYFWESDEQAPDYARTVDIHRKPGYDPVELFLDPSINFPKLKIAQFLLKKKLGFRALMEVIPLDATLVKGSHGRSDVPASEKPLVIGAKNTISAAEDIFDEILHHFFP